MSETRIILTAPPEDCQRAAAFGAPVAHMAYRVGSNGRLYRAALPPALRGGIMVLDAAGFDGGGDPSLLCRDVVRECAARRFEGILCDFDSPNPFLHKAVAQLGPLALQRGWSVWTTEGYASAWEKSTVLVPTAMSSGSLEARLREAIDRYGAGRTALAVQRMAQAFVLPAGEGCGLPLERGELAELVRRHSPAVFFDRNLCAHYFTYMERGSAHFILFDDSGSLLRKTALAAGLGITQIFFTFPEVEDILPRLLASE